MKTILRIAGILACVAASRLKKALRIAGTLACIAVFVLNLHDAVNDYGIKGKRHLVVFAQSGGSGSGIWNPFDICYTDRFYHDFIEQYCANTGEWEFLRISEISVCVKGKEGSCRFGFSYYYYTCGGYERIEDYTVPGICGNVAK